MIGGETTIQIAPTETHTRVAVVIGQSVAAYPPYQALVISGQILDAIIGCAPDEQTEIGLIGLPRIGVTATDARSIAIAIAATADMLLDEADLKF